MVIPMRTALTEGRPDQVGLGYVKGKYKIPAAPGRVWRLVAFLEQRQLLTRCRLSDRPLTDVQRRGCCLSLVTDEADDEEGAQGSGVTGGVVRQVTEGDQQQAEDNRRERVSVVVHGQEEGHEPLGCDPSPVTTSMAAWWNSRLTTIMPAATAR